MTTKIPTTLLDTTDPYPAGDGSALTHLLPLLHVRDEQASGTQGGTITASTWNVRTLNAVKTNEITGASVAANQITLPAGTYYIEALAPAYAGAAHKARLRNVTDNATAVVGTSEYNGTTGYAVSVSKVNGRFTLAAQKTLQLEHISSATQATNGMGYAVGSGEVEVYAEVKIWKIA